MQQSSSLLVLMSLVVDGWLYVRPPSLTYPDRDHGQVFTCGLTSYIFVWDWITVFTRCLTSGMFAQKVLLGTTATASPTDDD